MHPFGEYAAKTLGYKKIAMIGLDYAFGWETVGGFHKSFEDNGGQVIQKLWVPLNVQDYAPYIAQLRKDADAVFVNGLGRWTLLFAKQWAESGLRGLIPLIANGTYSDEHVLPQLGDESVGVISAHHYSAALETPANQKFRAAYEKAYQRMPGFYGENCYTGARIVGEAIKTINGRVEDRAAFMAALRQVKITDARRGRIWRCMARRRTSASSPTRLTVTSGFRRRLSRSPDRSTSSARIRRFASRMEITSRSPHSSTTRRSTVRAPIREDHAWRDPCLRPPRG